MDIDVQVERPVTVKANGKTIKLTNEEARELARKLNDALDVKRYPDYPWSPWCPYTTAPWENDTTIWYESTDGVTLGTGGTYTVEPISIELT